MDIQRTMDHQLLSLSKFVLSVKSESKLSGLWKSTIGLSCQNEWSLGFGQFHCLTRVSQEIGGEL